MAQRSDAVQNRGRILEAMRAEMIARGPEASMEAVARAAGVAVGTLYRHFPTKADLVRAVLQRHVAEVAGQLEEVTARVRGGADAGQEIRALMVGAVESQPQSRLLKEAAAALHVEDADSVDLHRLDRALGDLLSAAEVAGELRPGVRPGDVYLLMSTMPTDRSAATRHRWAQLVTTAILRDREP